MMFKLVDEEHPRETAEPPKPADAASAEVRVVGNYRRVHAAGFGVPAELNCRKFPI
jgi:hypothetical protein